MRFTSVDLKRGYCAAHSTHTKKKESREALINDSGEAPDIVGAKDKNSDARV